MSMEKHRENWYQLSPMYIASRRDTRNGPLACTQPYNNRSQSQNFNSSQRFGYRRPDDDRQPNMGFSNPWYGGDRYGAPTDQQQQYHPVQSQNFPQYAQQRQ